MQKEEHEPGEGGTAVIGRGAGQGQVHGRVGCAGKDMIQEREVMQRRGPRQGPGQGQQQAKVAEGSSAHARAGDVGQGFQPKHAHDAQD